MPDDTIKGGHTIINLYIHTMAITRTQAKKIKFSEEDEDEVGEIPQPVLEPVVLEEEDEGDDSSSDSDEAPEEESTNKSKQAVLETEKQLREQIVQQRASEREKRRELDLRYAAQQQQRKAEQEKLAKEQDQQQQQQQQQDKQEIPDYLPDDLLDDITSGKIQQKQKQNSLPKGKHVRLDVEEDKRLQLIAKLKQIKQSKSKAVEKAKGVFVKVDQNQGRIGKVVPKAEKKIVGSRDKWLKRKSLNRK